MQGEFVALTTAGLWAVSSVAYAHLGQRTHPLLLNFYKGAIATGFLALTVLFGRSAWPTVPPYAVGFLLLSGAIGIGLGDTAYFAALNAIGARRTLLIRVLAPGIAAIGAALWLGEQLPGLAWLGIGVTIAGIATVIGERTAASQTITEGQRGIWYAFLAALLDGLGAVLSRAALSQTTIEPLWSALLRLLGGTVVVGLMLGWQRRSVPWPNLQENRQLLQSVLVVAFFSTYLGIWLQQLALKLTVAGVAQTLNATSPLFVLPIVVWQGEKVSGKALVGVIVALVGVGILLWR